jgi:SAM-dependent methyltransferase
MENLYGEDMVVARQVVKRLLRVSGMLNAADRLLYLVTLGKVRGSNAAFVAANRDFALPPKWLAFDAYSAPDWAFYKSSGIETARYLAELADRYLPVDRRARVLEWGCGPARVVRHIADAFQHRGGAEVHGTDYNAQTIEWCQQSIPGVSFAMNALLPVPPLPFADGHFDFIYSISVFTHLSPSACEQWMVELKRVAASGAVLAITTNGDSWQSKMLPDELRRYRKDGVVFRGQVEEGKKMFSACHSPAYLRAGMFADMDILEHRPASFPYTAQDCWIVRKR